jgi:hypothetical protein
VYHPTGQTSAAPASDFSAAVLEAALEAYGGRSAKQQCGHGYCTAHTVITSRDPQVVVPPPGVGTAHEQAQPAALWSPHTGNFFGYDAAAWK